MSLLKSKQIQVLFTLVLFTSLLFTSCKDSSTSAIEEGDAALSSQTFEGEMANTTTNVFKSDGSVITYDVILAAEPGYPHSGPGRWHDVVCKDDGSGSIGLNAGWNRVDGQTAYEVGSQHSSGDHPWVNSFWSGYGYIYNWDAEWINAVNSINSVETYNGFTPGNYDNTKSGPEGGQNWTRYDMEIQGTVGETYKLQLLADNCSWIYLDGQVVGYQDDSDVGSPIEYGVSTNGDFQTLTFIIWDGNGLAGGKFRMETTTEDIPEFEAPEPKPETITLTGLVRDFKDSHPDFEAYLGDDKGIVESTLGSDDKPVYAGKAGNPTTTSKADFDQWYRDVVGVNLSTTFDFVLELQSDGTTYSFSDGEFFPIDGNLFGNEGRSHNYHFTTEIHTVFTYQGGETFTFTGDDDVWVFINEQLVIDLGGVHGPQTASVDLSTLGLVVGQDYSLDIFQAERRTTGSSFAFVTSLQLVSEDPEPVNNAPIANAGDDQTVPATGETTSVTLDGSGSSDPDGDELSYSWVLNGEVVATTESATVELADGNYTYTLTVSDGEETDSDDVSVTVENSGPNADAGDDQTVTASGQTTSVTLDGSDSSDPNGDILTFSWVLNGEVVATTESVTVELADGNYTYTLTVSDGEETDSDDVSVTIVNTIPNAEAGDDISTDATGSTTSISLDGSGSSDADGDALSYSWTLDGEVVATTETATIDLADGDYTLTLTVSDGQGASDSDDVEVSVVNTIPVANAGENQTHEATGTTTEVTLSGSATDADGDDLTYSWSNGDSGASTTVNLVVGSHTYTLTVTDEQGATHSDEVTIEITDTTAPMLSFNKKIGNLWPPNHKMVLVVTGISASDIVDGATDVTVTVESSQPANGKGDGNTDSDYEIVTNADGTIDVYVRAERSGKGKSGRTYTISMTTTDAEGNSSRESTEVTVAQNQGRGR